jgi:hypothetical protein
MSGKSDGPDYAGPLLEMALWRDRPKPKKQRRPKALSEKKMGELRPGQRHMGSLLRDIAEISVRYPTLTRGFTKQLRNLPKYENMDDRTLRRDVAEALASVESVLEKLWKRSPDLWPELLGIEPSPMLSKRALREKALEHLRRQLLAKTQ